MFSSCRYHDNAVSTIIFLLLAIVSWSRLQLNTCYPLCLIFFLIVFMLLICNVLLNKRSLTYDILLLSIRLKFYFHYFLCYCIHHRLVL